MDLYEVIQGFSVTGKAINEKLISFEINNLFLIQFLNVVL